MGSEHPDWLPVGWKVSLKIRSYGKKDKYYVSPKGLKFNSKPEVLRYIKTSGTDPKSSSKIEIKKTVAQNLPPGWIKEIRTKKKGAKSRTDPYYIDPVTGRYFRSMPEVFRYLQSNDSKKVESKLDGKGHITVKSGNHAQSSSPEPKGQRSADKKADEHLSAHESVKSGLKPSGRLKKAHLEQTEEDDSLAVELSDKLQLVTKEKLHSDRIQMKKLAESKANGKEDYIHRRRQSNRLSDIKPKDNAENQSLQPERNSVGEGLHAKPVARQQKRKSQMSDLPRRTSKRLAREEVKTVSGPAPTTDNKAECRTENEETIKVITHGSLSSLEEQDSSLKDLLMDPCIEFAIKTLTGAIPIDDLNKVGNSPVNRACASSSSVLPMNDIWADPCFEFAVKTLTSDIPAAQVEFTIQQKAVGMMRCKQKSVGDGRMGKFM